MDTLSYRTDSVSKERAEHKWYVIDAENQVVGRLSSKIASILRGKNKPSFTPHADTGDFVRDGSGTVAVQIGADDGFRAGTGKPARKRAADTTGGAGHHNDGVVDFHVGPRIRDAGQGRGRAGGQVSPDRAMRQWAMRGHVAQAG